MTTSANRTPASSSSIAVAGAAAEGSGALTGWHGLGSLARCAILAALAEADLPEDWAPKAKSAVGHAGNAIGALKNLGYFTRRARGAKWVKPSTFAERTREYQARWIVAVNLAQGAEVGEAAGRVVLTAELRDGSDTLHLTGDVALAQRVQADYSAAMKYEMFKAGDITSWLSSVLVRRCGAARYAMGYYIPASGRDVASRLVAAVASRWGTSWASPLLPVATSNELRIGIARGFCDEVASVARSLQAARDAARKESDGKNVEVSPSVASRLLRDLADVDSRTAAYRVLCGNDVLADAVAQLRDLHSTLADIADDSSMRFAMLDLADGPSIQAVPEPVTVSPAERAAEEALNRRQAERAPSVETLRARYAEAAKASGLGFEEFRARVLSRLQDRGLDQTPQNWTRYAELTAKFENSSFEIPSDLAPTPAPAPAPAPTPAPAPEFDDASARFDLLELD